VLTNRVEFDTLIREYGYVAIVVVTLFEGETIVLLAGAAAHFGYLELPWIIATALAGSVAGDQFWYGLGRCWGPRIISLRRSWQQKAERVYHHLRRHQDWLILSFRFYYGLRTITPFAIGSAHVPKLRFLILNFIGAVLWSVTFTFAGYFLGGATDYLVEDFRRYGLLALGGAALIGIAIVFTARVRRRSKSAPYLLQLLPGRLHVPEADRSGKPDRGPAP
jgi:membrane protein DedA with SNARE-associated domain